MKDGERKKRRIAVKRFLQGEKVAEICQSLGRSRAWLYKWAKRHGSHPEKGFQEASRRPLTSGNRTASEIEEIVIMVRLSLYNRDQFCGSQAILWELQDLQVKPLPSLRTISRILNRNELVHRRTGRYEPKGTLYPKLLAQEPNEVQQADLVGPRYLKGPIRYFSLNAVDITTARCGLHPMASMSGADICKGFWAIWHRLGIPNKLQVDNAMSFYGSPQHPRGMGPLIRLCLHNQVDLWFIPLREPWRNGVTEKFNDHHQAMFLNKVKMYSYEALELQSLAFEQRHNSTYRYSKLGGKTPLKSLSGFKTQLRFPEERQAPSYPLKKPIKGQYHLVRFIRSDLKLNIFGEQFPVVPSLKYKYVVATVDVHAQKLKVFEDKVQVEEFDYLLR
jgi:transposase-like protein/transposase InsO family protein